MTDMRQVPNVLDGRKITIYRGIISVKVEKSGNLSYPFRYLETLLYYSKSRVHGFCLLFFAH